MADEARRVYLLWHQHDLDDDDTAKLLGVYSTREKAKNRIASANLTPGFRRFTDAYTVDEYTVDKDEWTEGFATMEVDGRWADDPDEGSSEGM